MYIEPIFLEPIFKERIWGGGHLREMFDYQLPNNSIGEAWVISAHKNGPSKIINGPLKDKDLLQVWNEYPQLFGNAENNEEFPLLIKILDANDKLSVQVHPDDQYAREVAGEKYGKTECWYILDCEPGAEIIFGHHAQTVDEFKTMVQNGDWNNLLNRVKVKKGDFFYVPSGTIHAIGKGIVILEPQQSSDVTYRLYDYNRQDAEGNTRELHLDQAIDVTNFASNPTQIEKVKTKIDDLEQVQLVKEKNFTVYHWTLNGKVSTPLSSTYLLLNVIEGSGAIIIGTKEIPIKKGDHFILPATIKQYDVRGNMEFIVSHESK